MLLNLCNNCQKLALWLIHTERHAHTLLHMNRLLCSTYTVIEMSSVSVYGGKILSLSFSLFLWCQKQGTVWDFIFSVAWRLIRLFAKVSWILLKAMKFTGQRWRTTTTAQQMAAARALAFSRCSSKSSFPKDSSQRQIVRDTRLCAKIQQGNLELGELRYFMLGRKLASSLPAIALKQRFATILMLRPFNTVPSAVLTPNHKIISLPLHIFATVMNHNVNTWFTRYLICDPVGQFEPRRSRDPPAENNWSEGIIFYLITRI